MNSNTSNISQKAKNPSAHVTTSNQSCINCKNKHFIFQCESFRKLLIEKHFEIIKNAYLCINCLRSGGHLAKTCTSSFCHKCKKAHNTLLHFESSKVDGAKNDNQSIVPSGKPVNVSSLNFSSPSDSMHSNQ